jgi:integrase
MRKHCPDNERIKREYRQFLKYARKRSEASLDMVAKAIDRFEEDTNHRNFKKFRRQQAIAFAEHLAEQKNERTGKPLSRATRHSTLAILRAFFQWLAMHEGYKSEIDYHDADYFSLSERDTRIARTRMAKEYPSLEQVRAVIQSMPAGDTVQLRDRAVVAFILLTGVRDGAAVTVRLKHLDLNRRLFRQDAREVATKFGRSFDTYFFPVGDDIRQIVEAWVAYLEQKHQFGPDDVLFPATRQGLGQDGLLCAAGLSREGWADAGPIRKIFKTAFSGAGLPYYSPHRLRDTLAALGDQLCRGGQAIKAWSLNLGHAHVQTTLANYGPIASQQQGEIMRQMGEVPPPTEGALDALQELLDKYRRGASPS